MQIDRVAIRHVDKFPEPHFLELRRLVFEDVEIASQELAMALAEEGPLRDATKIEHPSMFRLGAYLGEELIGWTSGWMERGNVLYAASSGVTKIHRRQGIYTKLALATQEYARSNGAVVIRSQHSVLNNPVIIAKLHLGFHISGLSQSAHLGTLVEMTLHLSEKRSALLRARAIPYVPAGL
jgi:GNAT superfamily N-acetyltransferase